MKPSYVRQNSTRADVGQIVNLRRVGNPPVLPVNKLAHKKQSRNQRCEVSAERQAGRVPLGRRLPACPTESLRAAEV
jgi:hypothetical protein